MVGILSTFVSTSKCETGYQAGRYSAGQVTNKENLIKEGDPEITETRGLRKMVGILVSFWDSLFSGAMLVAGSVCVRNAQQIAETPKRSVSFIHIFIDQAPTRMADKCWTIVIPS